MKNEIKKICLQKLRSGYHINHVLEVLGEILHEIEASKEYIIAVDESQFQP